MPALVSSDALGAPGTPAQMARLVLSLSLQTLPQPSISFVLQKTNLKHREVGNLPRATQIGTGG